MRRSILTFLSLALCGVGASAGVFAQNKSFIPVEGASLKSRMEAAIKQARSGSQQKRFWVAYSFDVRPGVGIDVHIVDSDGSSSYYSVISGRFDPSLETRTAGIFLLYEQETGAIIKTQLYNPDRPRSFGGHPVYWLGRGGNQESLDLLRGLIQSKVDGEVAGSLVHAISLHDDPSVEPMLKDFARNSPLEKVRIAAVSSIRRFPGSSAFLADIVRNEQEIVEVRKIAAHFIGKSDDPTSLPTLESLYSSIKDREIKTQIVFAATKIDDKDRAADFLIRVARTDPDDEVRNQAIFWLGKKGGPRSLDALVEMVNDPNANTERQNHAVFVLSRRPKDEAVPALINVAKTHPKTEVRKQAIFWLSKTRDERALAFLQEILTK